MNETPKPPVSVIMPAYNANHFLESAIKSVFGQSYSNFEIILVDHGEKDSTARICRHFLPNGAFHDPRFRYFKADGKLPLSQARNIGVGKADGDLIVYLNHDDTLPFDSLEVRVKAQKNGRGGVYGDIYLIDEIGDEYRLKKSKAFENQEEALKAMLSNVMIPLQTPTLMVSKDVLKQFPSQDKYGTVEDIAVVLQLLKEIPLEYVEHPVYNFRTHTNNYSKRSRLGMICKWNMLYDDFVKDPFSRAFLKAKRAGATAAKFAFESITPHK